MTETPIVDTTSGKIQGRGEGPVHVFRGVPYARPPVGALRFRAPEPVRAAADVLDAGEYGPIAPQMVTPIDEQMYGGIVPPQSEDCLSLNVWTPGLDGERRPVFVWVHGGAFITGASRVPWYDGTRFAERSDAVLVSMNYRLGALGFLDLSVLGDEYAGSGCAGLLDQVSALEWVRDNIESFGGDSGNVTVFGESAGGISVVGLLAMPSARGLFHRAIAQSAVPGAFSTPDRGAEVLDLVLADVGLDRERTRQLVDAPLEQLVAAQGDIFAGDAFLEGMRFQPVTGIAALPEAPLDAARAGTLAPVPLITGTNRDELTLFTFMFPSLNQLTRDQLVEQIERAVGSGEQAATLFHAYAAARPELSPSQLGMVVLSDGMFRVPTLRLAERHHAAGNPTWCYRFDYESPAFGGAMGAAHSFEIPFVFDNIDDPGAAFMLGSGEPQRRLAAAMHGAWIAFARDGSPQHPDLPEWPRFDDDRRATMRFDLASEVVDDLDGTDRARWDGAF